MSIICEHPWVYSTDFSHQIVYQNKTFSTFQYLITVFSPVVFRPNKDLLCMKQEVGVSVGISLMFISCEYYLFMDISNHTLLYCRKKNTLKLLWTWCFYLFENLLEYYKDRHTTIITLVLVIILDTTERSIAENNIHFPYLFIFSLAQATFIYYLRALLTL